MSDLQNMVIALLAIAVVVASARMAWFAQRRVPRARAWRIVVLLSLQMASALLLYRTLFPPPVAIGDGTLVVATAQAPDGLATTLAANETLIALPEAGAVSGAERVPDLATALRRHPQTARLRIVGRGLTARDRDSVQGLPFNFAAAPLPRGLVELPSWVEAHAGAEFVVTGRVNAVNEGSVELLDPAGQRVDRQPLASDGRFRLTGAARGPGLASFHVRVRDARGERVEDANLPVAIAEPTPLRVLVLAGAPDAELKYLRRWALDSGVRLTSQIQVGGGVQLGDAPVAFDAATLANYDAVIVDERTWDALGSARRRALTDAVRKGLGLLVRITGPVPASVRTGLETLGLRIASAPLPPTFRLATRADDEFAAVRLGPGSPDAPTASTVAAARLPELSRQSLRIEGAQVHAWLRDDAGRALAAWHSAGEGRVAAWLPRDTYQLVLVGREDLHAGLWSDAIAQIARPVAAAKLAVPDDGRRGTRMTLCGLDPQATVAPAGGAGRSLPIDPATGAAHCAGFWPATTGWHTLRSGKATATFFVRDSDELPGVAAHADREATRRLALQPPHTSEPRATAPGTRWPWFLGWLLVSVVLWWLERSRWGRAQAAS